jgi:hypothetical protein
MNTNIKNSLGIAGVLGILVVAFAVFSYVNSYDKSIQPSSFRSYTVTGEGKVAVVPDIATFTFTVLTEGGKDLAAVQTENAKKSADAVEFVKSKGVDAKDIRTTNSDIEPRYESYNCYLPMVGTVGTTEVKRCPPPSIVGYTMTTSYEVKVRDFTKAGEILSGVVNKGANQVGQLTFKVDDPEKAKSEARAKAIEQAKAKSEDVARAGGFSRGRLLSIEENTPYVYDRAYGMGGVESMSSKVMSDPTAASIEAGSQDVIVTVYLRYEIQ